MSKIINKLNIRRIKDAFVHSTRRDILAGIVIILPLYVAWWVASALFMWIFNFYQSLPDQWKPASYFGEDATVLLEIIGFVLLLVITFSLLSVIGWVSRQYIGDRIIKFLSHQLKKIPILGTIYGAVQQLAVTMGSGQGSQFRGVVFVQFPRDDSWAIGFVTGEVKHAQFPKGMINVFVPTVPNPTSGFHLMVPEKDVQMSDLRVEEAFKIILSLGMAQTDEK